MSAHHDELQDIETAKHFWRSGGKWIFAAIIAAALAYLGYTVYQTQAASKAADAATAAAKVQAGDASALQTLQNQYPAAATTAHVTLSHAALLFNEGKHEEAAAAYRWILEQNKDALLQTIALQNLATVYLQQEKYDEALQIASTSVDATLQGILDETRGDILAAQGKNEEARTAYQNALNRLSADAPERESLQLKINAL